MGLIIWELSETIGNPNIGGIANAAHLVGVLTGVVYALYLKYNNNYYSFKKNYFEIFKKLKTNYFNKKTPEEEINRILDKIGKQGIGSLTKEEKNH